MKKKAPAVTIVLCQALLSHLVKMITPGRRCHHFLIALNLASVLLHTPSAQSAQSIVEDFGKILGQGSFGKVATLVNDPHTVVKFSNFSWNDPYALINLREAIILSYLNHRHIIKPKKISWGTTVQGKKQLLLYLPRAYPATKTTKDLLEEVSEALRYLHSRGMAHTDLKPQHLMQVGEEVKLVDFGSCELDVTRAVQFNKTTSHFRSPENLFGLFYYPRELDIWSLGMAILRRENTASGLEAIFSLPDSVDINDRMIYALFKTFGTPSIGQSFYRELFLKKPELALYDEAEKVYHKYQIKTYPQKPLSSYLSGLAPDLLDLLNTMLDPNPITRITALQMKQHPYFEEKKVAASSIRWVSLDPPSPYPPTGKRAEFFTKEFIQLNLRCQSLGLNSAIFFESAAIFSQMIKAWESHVVDIASVQIMEDAAILLALIVNDEVTYASELISAIAPNPRSYEALCRYLEDFLQKEQFDILHDHSFRFAARQGKTTGLQASKFLESLRSEILLSGNPYVTF